jgi:hypothetical protein
VSITSSPTIDGELIVVLLHDSMTHAEKTLVHAGRHAGGRDPR